MDATQMALTTMNPETRTLYKVTCKDIDKFEKILEDLMGDDSEPRKKFLLKNSDIAKIIN